MPPRMRAAPAAVSALADASTAQLPRAAPFARAFSSTPCRARDSKARARMMKWFKSVEGTRLAEGGGPRYLGPFADQPFPHNPLFRSQAVLSDQAKSLICDKIEAGQTIKEVSAELGVDVRRVAAVVRLRAMEKQAKPEDKLLAKPYAKAIMSFLPKTYYDEGNYQPHEPINEVLVHPKTTLQLFVPTSESREYTREDAAASFHETVRSVDARSPHQQLIQMERRVLKGEKRADSMEKFVEATRAEEDRLATKIEAQRVLAEKQTTKHRSDRFEFRIKDFDSGRVGPDGKSSTGTGWRYGVPHNDRKRDAVKIPTQVPEAN